MSGYFLYQGNLEPPLLYQIKELGQPVDLTNKTVTFSMRTAGSSVLELDHVSGVTIIDAATGMVSWDWSLGQTDRPGEMLAWFTTAPNSDPTQTQDTPEFDFPIFTHSIAWASAADIATCAGVDVTSPGLIEAAQWGTDIMQSLLARQFRGLTRDTIRPARVGCACWLSGSAGLPMFWGAWGNYLGWGNVDVPTPLGCGPLNEYKLAYPVREVTQVKVDGVVLDPSAYRVDENQWLVRVVPNAQTPNIGWPSCQNLAIPDTEPGTWSVTYVWGTPPPQLAVDAATALGCQLYLSANGKACSLPVGATKITRQGVTIDRGLMADWTKGGSVGIPLVDAAIRAYNPNRLLMTSSVYSPDLPKYGRHTGL